MEKTMSMQENVMQMMNDEMESLSTKLYEAKMAFADITLEEGDYRCRDERKTDCKVLEGQMHIVQKMMDKVSSIVMDIKMPPLARI